MLPRRSDCAVALGIAEGRAVYISNRPTQQTAPSLRQRNVATGVTVFDPNIATVLRNYGYYSLAGIELTQMTKASAHTTPASQHKARKLSTLRRP